MSSDNVTSGDNQQETASPRFEFDPQWVVGFVDEEGSSPFRFTAIPPCAGRVGGRSVLSSKCLSTAGIERCSKHSECSSAADASARRAQAAQYTSSPSTAWPTSSDVWCRSSRTIRRQAAQPHHRGSPCGILRDCTPGPAVADGWEDTVRSSWRHEESGRNDLTRSQTDYRMRASNNNA